eukprot:6770157-Lingulodinium_polyedra.AAC.1
MNAGRAPARTKTATTFLHLSGPQTSGASWSSPRAAAHSRASASCEPRHCRAWTAKSSIPGPCMSGILPGQ